MTKPCPRAWEVEAARDGRLLGKDLDSALRHRATCAECTAEERELAALGSNLARLPELARDPLTVRRSRQQLMASLNESIIGPAEPRRRPKQAFAVALSGAALFAGWFFVGPALTSSRSVRELDAASVVEVRAQAGARWSEHADARLDRVDLLDGTAAFSVRPHPGRRVVVHLPDGEIEDLGTVFELSVAAGQTRRIAVNVGRVSVHLNGQPDFTLGAGQTWAASSADDETTRASASSASVTTIAPADLPRTSASSNGAAPAPRAHAVAAPENRAAASNTGNAAAPEPTHSAGEAPSAKAEDDAYLRIVALLKQGHDNEARGEAKRYLLLFPNGFRRVEVLNIATRDADDAGADAH